MLWTNITPDDNRIASHSTFHEIEDAEYEGDNCFLSGVEVWDVDTDSDGISYCELVGLRMDGLMLHPDVLTAIVGASAMTRSRELAMERFQGEIDAGDWREAA